MGLLRYVAIVSKRFIILSYPDEGGKGRWGGCHRCLARVSTPEQELDDENSIYSWIVHIPSIDFMAEGLL